MKVELHSFFIVQRDGNLWSASLPSFFNPEDVTPATFEKWDCMWTNFPGKVFWNVTPCSLVCGYWSFRGTRFSPILSWKRMLGHITYLFRVLFIYFFFPFTIDFPLSGINVGLEYEPTSFYISVPVTNFLAARFFLFFIQSVFWGASQVAYPRHNAWVRQPLTLRSLTLYIYGAPILDVSRSHTTTQHSR